MKRLGLALSGFLLGYLFCTPLFAQAVVKPCTSLDGGSCIPVSSSFPLPVIIGSGSTSTLSLAASTTGGATPIKYLSAANTNSTNVKATAGTIYNLVAINTTATLYYLKLYDKATAPTCASDTVLQSYPVPASTSGNGLSVSTTVGIAFTAGIGFCLTGALADNDNTNAATGVVINIIYK